MLTESLNEYTYNAEVAGLSYYISLEQYGIMVIYKFMIIKNIFNFNIISLLFFINVFFFIQVECWWL